MGLDKALTGQSSMPDVFERDNHSFSYWRKLYYNIHIVGPPENTITAKNQRLKTEDKGLSAKMGNRKTHPRRPTTNN